MNSNVIIVVLAYLVVGGYTKFLMLPTGATPGEKWAVVIKIFSGALLVGGIARLLPTDFNVWIATSLFCIPFLGDVLGVFIGQWIDDFRVWIDGKRVEDERGKDKGPASTGPEQRGRNGHSGGNGEDVGRKVKTVSSDTRKGPGENNEATSGGSNGVG